MNNNYRKCMTRKGACTCFIIFVAIYFIFRTGVYLNNERRVISFFNDPPKSLWIFNGKHYQRSTLWNFHDKSLFAVTLVRNKARFLKEWVDFHLKQGIEFIFIYTHNASDVETELVLMPYIKSKKVALIDAERAFPELCSQNYPRFEHWFAWCQCEVFNQALHVLRISLPRHDRNKWLAVFDVDEFIYGHSKCLHKTLTEDIPQHIDSVQVQGYSFGTSGFENNSQFENIIDTHLRRSSVDIIYKSISRVWNINIEYTGVHLPHCIIFFLCEYMMLPIVNPYIHFNHYQYISMEEHRQKIAMNANNHYREVYRDTRHQNELNSVFDNRILNASLAC